MNFITGNKFKNICDYIYDEEGFRKTNISNSIPIFFVKTDYINNFFLQHVPEFRFKLITHNSDHPITEKHLGYLNIKNLDTWFAQNVNFIHPKLISIPIGIANERWKHGNETDLLNTIKEKNKKENLIYCNFDLRTNINERTKCLKSLNNNGLKLSERKNFKEYLSELSKSYFSISPNGNGIDCHKTWESMYLKTIPIVTKSINIDFYKEYPIYIIKDWESFDSKKITIELYKELIKKTNKSSIDFEFFCKKNI